MSLPSVKEDLDRQNVVEENTLGAVKRSSYNRYYPI